MKGVMVDIETLGKGSQAAMISIGAVIFNTNTGELGKEFYSSISLDSSVKYGMVMDALTVVWWMQQSDEARLAFQGNESAPDLSIVLDEFSEWYPPKTTFWGNGATFDNVIVSNAYDLAFMKRPWDFWEDRCYRTLKNLHSDVSMDEYGVAHNALDDAKKQALHLLKIFAKKGLTGDSK